MIRTFTLSLATIFAFSGCTKCSKEGAQPGANEQASTNTANTQPANPAGQPATPAGEAQLVIVDQTVGTGEEAVNGKRLTVHYVGKLENGTEFDNSLTRGAPLTFELGRNQVIPGWEKGVTGMKVGGKRKMTIPPTLGYGENGVPGVIPPNSTLIFDVELLKVE